MSSSKRFTTHHFCRKNAGASTTSFVGSSLGKNLGPQTPNIKCQDLKFNSGGFVKGIALLLVGVLELNLPFKYNTLLNSWEAKMIETDLFSRLMMICIQKEKFLIFTSSLSSNFKHTQPKRPDKRARIQLKINLHKSFRKTVQQQKYKPFWLKG